MSQKHALGLSLVLLLLIPVLLGQSVLLGALIYKELNQTKAELAQMQKDAELHEGQRDYYDKNVLIEDWPGFAVDGIIEIPEDPMDVLMRKLMNEDHAKEGLPPIKPIVYSVLETPGFYHKGVWYEIDAIQGETIHLMYYRDEVDNLYLGYYTCYTNSAHCAVDITVTDIKLD